MKKGLILEGGAMRGMFTAGVLDVFMENGIEFDGVVGVSAGAAFGCNVKSHQIGRTIRYNEKYCKNWRYCSRRSLLLTGNMYGKDFCYRRIPEELDVFDKETYNRSSTRFCVVATNVETGMAEYKYFDKADDGLIDYIRASSSMPLVSEIVEIDGKKYLDGGIADSIPLRFFESEGYDRNVVVLTREDGYVKGENPLMPLVKIMLRRYPSMIRAIETRHEMYNAQTQYVRERESSGEVFVIRPDAPLPLKQAERDPEKLRYTYELGRQKAMECIDKVKAFLED